MATDLGVGSIPQTLGRYRETEDWDTNLGLSSGRNLPTSFDYGNNDPENLRTEWISASTGPIFLSRLCQPEFSYLSA